MFLYSRVWPRHGFWSSSEFSLTIERCIPPDDRCLGGRNSECGDGYENTLCQTCSHGYYEDTNICRNCDETTYAEVILTIIVAVSFFSALGLFIALLSDGPLDRVFVFVIGKQMKRNIKNSQV
jgi:hypothetical protein